MRKSIILCAAACVFLMQFMGVYALAADENRPPNNVNITVVMPEIIQEEPAPAAPERITMFPVDVTEVRDNGGWEIIRTYALLPGESPQDIPQGSFERSGWRFNLTEIIRRESTSAETREHSETITLDTNTNQIEQILSLLSPTIDFRDGDGFVGVLALDVSSIKVEVAGTRRTSHTMTVTREYHRLSSNDTSHIPKTVTDRGTTYSLYNVDWRVGNYSTVDYEQIADYYTAVATYTATGTRTTVTGYTTTAVYNGSLARMSQGQMFFTAHFLGEEIRTPLEMVTPGQTAATPEPEANPPDEEPAEEPIAEPTETPQENGGKPTAAWLAIALCLAIMAGGAYYFIKKRKDTTNHEKTDYRTPDADHDGGDGSPGAGR